MQYGNLGRTGLKVSRLCLGMMSYGTPKWRDWVLSEEDSKPFVKRALEAGINFFDSADIYSIGVSEEVTGRTLLSLANRHDLVIATKVHGEMSKDPNNRGLSRKHILQAIDDSLRRLGTDFVDLYQIHRYDPTTPIEETMEALHDVVKAGKARYIGASSMYTWQFIQMQHVAEKHGWTRFVAMQNHYNLVYREEEREMIPYCMNEGVGLIPWSPLARGFLAGNRAVGQAGEKSGATTRAKSDGFAHHLYYQEADFRVLDAVIALADQRRIKPAQLALAWMLHKPGINSPIIGATKMYQLDEALAALDIQLSSDEIASLEAPYVPHPVLGHS